MRRRRIAAHGPFGGWVPAAAAVARLDLVRTLRELGLGLDDIRQVLHGDTTVAELVRGSDIEEAKQMTDLARLSAQERQQIIDDFVDRTFAGDAITIAQRMRTMPAELPDDPTPEQVDAWVELAGLVADEGFQRRVRAMVLAGPPLGGPDHGAVIEHAGRALTSGIDPASPEGKHVLGRIVPPPR